MMEELVVVVVQLKQDQHDRRELQRKVTPLQKQRSRLSMFMNMSHASPFKKHAWWLSHRSVPNRRCLQMCDVQRAAGWDRNGTGSRAAVLSTLLTSVYILLLYFLLGLKRPMRNGWWNHLSLIQMPLHDLHKQARPSVRRLGYFCMVVLLNVWHRVGI